MARVRCLCPKKTGEEGVFKKVRGWNAGGRAEASFGSAEILYNWSTVRICILVNVVTWLQRELAG